MKGIRWAFLILLLVPAPFSGAEDGATDKEILIGMSNAQTGFRWGYPDERGRHGLL